MVPATEVLLLVQCTLSLTIKALQDIGGRRSILGTNCFLSVKATLFGGKFQNITKSVEKDSALSKVLSQGKGRRNTPLPHPYPLLVILEEE